MTDDTDDGRNEVSTSRRSFLAGAATLGAGAAGLSQVARGSRRDAGDGESSHQRFRVRIENAAPTDFYSSDSHTGGAVWLTPGAYGVHTGSNPVFTEGDAASVGLEALAEAGPPTGFAGEPGLLSEIQNSGDVVAAGAYTPANTVTDPNDPTGNAPGAPPIAPGGAFEFNVRAEPGQKLSFASMFVPSNDVFVSPGADGIPLFENGTPVDGDVTSALDLWDAGTEPNGEPGFGPDQAPAQNAADQGDDEGGVVRRLSAVGDGHDYPDPGEMIAVTVEPVDPTPFVVTVENVSTPNTLQTSSGSVAVPLSPGAYAVHDAAISLFDVGGSASPGLEALAEDGTPGTLAGELSGVGGVLQSGTFAGPQTETDPNQPPNGPQPPIFPGGSYQFTVAAAPGERLSLATMFVQSNDLFYAPGPHGISLFDDGVPVAGDVTDQLTLWDAGTEVDQSPGEGPDQAPRQSATDTGAEDDDSSTVRAVADVNSESHAYPDPTDVIRVRVRPLSLASPIGSSAHPPGNLDDDPLLEDVDGDGDSDVFDAVTYFNNRNSDVIQDNPAQFDFDGDGTTGTVFDAVELYNESN